MAARVSRIIFAKGITANKMVGMIQYLGCDQSGRTLIHFSQEAKIRISSNPSTKTGMEANVVKKVDILLSKCDLAHKAETTPSGIPSTATTAKAYAVRRMV